MTSLRFTIDAGALALALLVPFNHLHAQEPDTVPPDTVFQIDALIVTGQRQTTTVGGASAVVVTPDSLPVKPVASLEDAFRAMPFVLVRQNSRGMAEISVRGSESRQVAVLMDGVPLTLGWDHRTDPSIIPLIGAQGIGFVRGLSSILGGPNVLGGVIEVDVAHAPYDGHRRTSVRAVAGMDDVGGRSIGATIASPVSMGGGELLVRAGAGYNDRPGVALAGDVEDASAEDGLRTNTDLEKLDGFAAMRWRGGGAWGALSATGYTSRRGVPPELHVAEPRLWRYPEESRVVAAFSAGTGHRETPWGKGDLETSIGLNLGRQEIESYATLAYDQVAETESGDERTLTVRLLGDHTLGRNGEVKAAATYADVSYGETLDGAVHNDYRQRLWSLASELAWRFPAETRVSAGVTLDGADTPETGGKPPLGTLTAPGVRFGFSTLALRPGLRLHASASDRARFPALRELYSGALGRFDPNPDLEPERLFAAETGLTFKRPGIELQGVGFHHRLRDAVVRTTTPEGLYRRVNRDEIRSTGIELLAGATLGGTILSGDLVVQRVTGQDPTVPESESQPEHMPEVRAGLDVDAALPGRFRALATVDYTGEQYCVHPDLGTNVQLDPSTRVDLGVRRTWVVGQEALVRRVRTTVSLDNVADAAVYDQCGMPQPGRMLRVGIEVF